MSDSYIEHWLTGNLLSTDRLSVVGEAKAAAEIASQCEPLVADTQVERPDFQTAAQDARAQIEQMDVIVAVGTDGGMLEMLFSAAKPFCRILVLGPVEHGKRDINFYDSVHSKNLQVTFVSTDGTNLN